METREIHDTTWTFTEADVGAVAQTGLLQAQGIAPEDDPSFGNFVILKVTRRPHDKARLLLLRHQAQN